MQHRAGGSRRATERIDVSVFVLDHSGQPLMPCSEKRARLLLARDRARVHRLIPFAIRLIDRQAADCAFQPLHCRLLQQADGYGYAWSITPGKDSFPASPPPMRRLRLQDRFTICRFWWRSPPENIDG